METTLNLKQGNFFMVKLSINICDTLLIITMVKSSSSMQATQKNQEKREEEKGDTS